MLLYSSNLALILHPAGLMVVNMVTRLFHCFDDVHSLSSENFKPFSISQVSSVSVLVQIFFSFGYFRYLVMAF
uniref:Uncharacterized protein n=1 Tax=Anguilla anguilla TaxID=7936 RepID=A0A0E9Q1G8_ANGAN